MMASRETINMQGPSETYPRIEVFSRVEASFDREWVEYIGTDLCRILEEIEKLGVEITFRKGQHVVCGTFKQIQYIEEHLCHGTSSGRQSRESWPVGGRAFESLPAQHSSSFYRGNRSGSAELSFDKEFQNYGTASPRAHPTGVQAPYVVNQERERWGGPLGGVSYLGGQSSSNIGADYRDRGDASADGMYYGNVPSDYSSESIRLIVNRDTAGKEDNSGKHGKTSESEIKRGVNDQSSNEEIRKNVGSQLTSSIKEDKQAIRKEESKSPIDLKKGKVADAPQEVDGLSQELMVDKDILEYLEVKMAPQWNAIQEFGAKIDKIVDESGMVRLRITPAAETDDSDIVGLVYDSLAGLYNDVQSRIIMEVLNLRPSSETDTILAMVMQYIIERYPLVYLKCCPQRDHYYFIGPLQEVHRAFRMFQFAYRTAMENEIKRIQQLGDKLHDLELQASKIMVDRNTAQGAATAGESFGASADSRKEERYEGMATGGGNPSGWSGYDGDHFGDISYRGDDYTGEHDERDADERGDRWCDPLKVVKNTNDATERDRGRIQGIESYIVIARVGDRGYYNEEDDWKSSTGEGRNKTDRFDEGKSSLNSTQNPQSVFDGKNETAVLTKKKSDNSYAEEEKVDELTKWGSIRMKSESASTGKAESFDTLKNLNKHTEDAADRDYTVPSLSRVESSSSKVNADELHSLPEKDDKMNVRQGLDGPRDDDSKTDQREIRSIDSDDTEEDEEEIIDKGMDRETTKTQIYNPASKDQSKLTETVNSQED